MILLGIMTTHKQEVRNMDMVLMANLLHKAYLSYVNEYLTVSTFADHHCISDDEAQAIIDAGRIIHEARCKGA